MDLVDQTAGAAAEAAMEQRGVAELLRLKDIRKTGRPRKEKRREVRKKEFLL